MGMGEKMIAENNKVLEQLDILDKKINRMQKCLEVLLDKKPISGRCFLAEDCPYLGAIREKHAH